jgi:hypothetical protein
MDQVIAIEALQFGPELASFEGMAKPVKGLVAECQVGLAFGRGLDPSGTRLSRAKRSMT